MTVHVKYLIDLLETEKMMEEMMEEMKRWKRERMRMRMAPISMNRLSAAMLLLVVMIVGCLLLTQCDAQTTRQNRIKSWCGTLFQWYGL